MQKLRTDRKKKWQIKKSNQNLEKAGLKVTNRGQGLPHQTGPQGLAPETFGYTTAGCDAGGMLEGTEWLS